ncbi:uncharacterized protein PAF06_016822 [Gastrophryne carolinensis]
MEEQGAKKSTMDPPPHFFQPPPYLPRMSVTRRSCAWASVVVLLLAVIVVGATLIGVYMTQKHTEAVVELALKSASGEKVQQTVMVNDKQNVAAFYVNMDNTSTTFLYDYNQGIVGFRRLGEKECYVMRMKDTKVPTMEDVLNSIKVSPGQDSGTSEITYNFQPGEEKADRTKLGLYINLLCSDQPIYWGVREQPQQRGWFKKKWKKFKNLIKKPPFYLPKSSVSRKTWAWASVTLLLLAVVVVGATLIGVYMTQKHTEAVVEMALQSATGEKVQQTVMVNDKENVAASHVNIGNTSTTILYDYNRGIVGFRQLGDNECYVMRMEDTKVPTMKDVLSSIKNSPGQNGDTSEFNYNFLRERTKLTAPNWGFISTSCAATNPSTGACGISNTFLTTCEDVVGLF